jgi:uncharacterized protein (TIGR03000 family)
MNPRRCLPWAITLITGITASTSFAQKPDSSEPRPVRLTIHLPADAEVEVDGAKLEESGEVRQFESAPLAAGKKHVLKLKASWMEGDSARTLNKKLVVAAGQELELDFNLEDLGPDGQKVLELVNQERQKAGLPAYKVSVKLSCAARGHSANMAKQNVLSHQLDGQSAPQRIAATGYRFVDFGENIATARTPAEVVRNWMNSAGHRQNILEPKYKEIGVGLTPGRNGRKFWTLVFATRAEAK